MTTINPFPASSGRCLPGHRRRRPDDRLMAALASALAVLIIAILASI